MSKGMVPAGWKRTVDHGCVMKIRHQTESAAAEAMGEVGDGGEVYPCPFCDGWHWGRSLTHPEWPDHAVRQWRQWAQLQRKLRWSE